MNNISPPGKFTYFVRYQTTFIVKLAIHDILNVNKAFIVLIKVVTYSIMLPTALNRAGEMIIDMGVVKFEIEAF